MLGFVLMILAISQLNTRCREAEIRYYLGVLPRIANLVSMLIGVVGGAVAYFSIVGTFPKKPQK